MGINHNGTASTGFFVGFVFNYAFHANMTFEAAGSIPALIRFVAVVAINYCLTILFVSVADTVLGSALIGKIASLPFVAINGFLLSKHWVFKKLK